MLTYIDYGTDFVDQGKGNEEEWLDWIDWGDLDAGAGGSGSGSS